MQPAPRSQKPTLTAFYRLLKQINYIIYTSYGYNFPRLYLHETPRMLGGTAARSSSPIITICVVSSVDRLPFPEFLFHFFKAMGSEVKR